MNLQPGQPSVAKKTCSIFQLAISKLAIKTNKVDIRVIVSKLPVKVDIHINGA